MKNLFKSEVSVGDVLGWGLAIAILLLGIRLESQIDSLRKIEKYDLKVLIDSPRPQPDGASFIELKGYLQEVSGSISSSFDSSVNIQTEMSKQGLVLVPFVKPLAGEQKWIASPEIEVNSDGSFTDYIQIGEEGKGAGGSSVKYKIHVVLVNAGYFTPGDKLINLPKGSGKSNLIPIHRVE